MARKTLLPPLALSDESKKLLTDLSGSMTAPAREVIRAKVLLHYANGEDISSIKRLVGISRPAIYKCIGKALAAGAPAGLKDTYHSPKAPEILDDAKAWVVSLACTKPKDHGLASELWTLSALARYVATHAVEAGFPRLAKAAKATVWRILNEHDIKPHRIRYYLEKRDPEFDRKMQEVLMVYQDVSLFPAGATDDTRSTPIYTVSVDEKPGVQAIGLTAPDLPPVPGKESSIARDYEYVRHGTLSILAALDLHTGEIIAKVVSLSIFSSALTLITRLMQSSEWCWITTPRTFQRKPWHIWHPDQEDLSMSIRQNMVLGSIWLSVHFQRWLARSCATSVLLPRKN
jgi:transposase